MRRAHTATRWVIVGRHGLYTGQHLTRRAAILEHVNAKGVPCGITISVGTGVAVKTQAFRVPIGEKALREGWRYWRKQGDRAIKATITWEETTS